MLGFYLFIVHVLTTDVHFLNKALFKDRNFILSTVMFFAVGFVLLPTLALTSPMLEELLDLGTELHVPAASGVQVGHPLGGISEFHGCVEDSSRLVVRDAHDTPLVIRPLIMRQKAL